MRIVHLSTNDLAGGAARAAYRLHHGLQRLGHDSRMFVMNRTSNDPSVIQFAAPRSPVDRVRRHLRRSAMNRDYAPYQLTRPVGLEPFSDDRSMHGGDILKQLPSADVLTLHWVAGFVDYRTFFQSIPRHIPVVWRLSDMNPFTGGCHYDEGCERFVDSSGACPQLGSLKKHDLSQQIWSRKHAAFAAYPKGRLHIVALSRWIADEARRSSLFHALPISIIPNGIDPQIFAPRDRTKARQLLGIDQNAKVVMFSAGSVTNRRKGFSELVAALSGLPKCDKLVLVSLGGGKQQLDVPIRHIHLGHVGDDEMIAQAYSAADAFVIPSLQENLPNTALESMACGTPVVGFNAGGIPDLVRPYQTGLLAPVGDIAELRLAINTLLNDEQPRIRLGTEGRRVVLAEYTPELQIQRYVTLYETLISAEPIGAMATQNGR